MRAAFELGHAGARVLFFGFSLFISQIWLPFCEFHISSNIDPNEVIPIVFSSRKSVVFRKNIKCICVV
jgi:hypothetical protein